VSHLYDNLNFHFRKNSKAQLETLQTVSNFPEPFNVSLEACSFERRTTLVVLLNWKHLFSDPPIASQASGGTHEEFARHS
jgi:hypothetical protein